METDEEKERIEENLEETKKTTGRRKKER
jgi:hypothetical protein